jgi:hypothetical protein
MQKKSELIRECKRIPDASSLKLTDFVTQPQFLHGKARKARPIECDDRSIARPPRFSKKLEQFAK